MKAAYRLHGLKNKKISRAETLDNTGAGDEARTRDVNLGKVAFYR